MQDQATYANPALPSREVRELLVSGQVVIAGGQLVAQARPGRAVRAATC
ncbi:MAG: hypothetical protein K2P79_08190 [Sphingomonas sp.]|nr:hypothetical protein [Sphingomonas sp.]